MIILIDDNRYDISPGTGVYFVVRTDHKGHQTNLVGKDKRCSCGGSARRPCRHIEAVAAYLKRGGARAPQAEIKHDPTPQPRMTACPICGAATELMDGGVDAWRCTEDSSHYWQWRGERVRKFLTQPQPGKIGAYYDQTPEQREAFLAAAKARHDAHTRAAYAAQ
jgi:hypothetical protein